MKERFYKPELDALRFAAFLAVFLAHTIPSNVLGLQNIPLFAAEWIAAASRAGRFGVALFFVLSSYLITALLLREYDQTGRLDVRAFYVRRTLRIWPLYFIFLGFALVIAPYILPHEHLPPSYIIPFLTFTGNWATSIFGNVDSIVNPLWSISVEEQFYLVWPLLITWLGKRRILILVLGAVGLGWCARIMLLMAPQVEPFSHTFVWLDAIAVGALLAVFVQHYHLTWSLKTRLLLVTIGGVLLIITARYTDRTGPTSLIFFPASALACLIIVAAVLDCGVQPPKIIIELGKRSYGLYVWHELAIALTLTLSGRVVVRSGAALAITIILALASYRWIEYPFLQLKQRFTHVVSRPD